MLFFNLWRRFEERPQRPHGLAAAVVRLPGHHIRTRRSPCAGLPVALVCT